MKKTSSWIYIGLFLLCIVPLTSASHWIIGTFDGDANGRKVFLYSQSLGMNQNISDIVGVDGNSGTDNFYMLDVETLYACAVGDEVRITLDGVNYIPIIISGAGYDVAQTLSFDNFMIQDEEIINITSNISATNENVSVTNVTEINTNVTEITNEPENTTGINDTQNLLPSHNKGGKGKNPRSIK